MIEIVNKIKDYNEANGRESCVEVRNDWSDSDFIHLKVEEKSYKLLAKDLRAAITNATNTANWQERALKAEKKLTEIKNFCQKELDNITEKPSSQVDPYRYGYLSGVERVADWILDDFFSRDDEKESNAQLDR